MDTKSLFEKKFKEELSSECALEFEKLVKSAEDKPLQITWELLMHHPLDVPYYGDLLPYFASWIVYQEMLKRGIAPQTLIFGKVE